MQKLISIFKVVSDLKVVIMCKGRKLQAINILSFNVEGLKPKLGDPNFIDFIQKYDVVIFTEIWKADTSKINIEGYWDYSQIRPEHTNATRHSGGITVLAKHITDLV